VLPQLADAAADASKESRFFLVVVLRRHASASAPLPRR
jgi:hypothetical protein